MYIAYCTHTHIHENLHLLATVSRAAKTASVANIVQHLEVITCRVGLLPERHDLPEKNTKGPHVWLTRKHTIHQRFRSHPPVNIAFLSTNFVAKVYPQNLTINNSHLSWFYGFNNFLIYYMILNFCDGRSSHCCYNLSAISHPCINKNWICDWSWYETSISQPK